MGAVPTIPTKFRAPGLSPAPGTLAYRPGLVPLYTELAKLFNDAGNICELWILPGGVRRSKSGNRLVEINIVDLTQRWVADNDLITYETDPAISGGARRWVFTNQAEEGFRGTLSRSLASMPGYSILLPSFELTSTTGFHAVFGAGTGLGARSTAYITGAGAMVLNHNNDPKTSATVVSSGVRTGLGWSYKDSDKGIVYYANEAQIGTLTSANSPVSALNAGIFGSADDGIDCSGKSMGIFVLNIPIHDAAYNALRASIFAIMAKIRNFAV